MKNIILFLLLPIFLLGCASSYKKNGFSGGYSEIQLDKNIYQVYFRGNGFTSIERAEDFAMLRSAELTLEKGYKYFLVYNSKNSSHRFTYTEPQEIQTNINMNTNGTLNNYGHSAVYSSSSYGTSYTKISGGKTYDIIKPNTKNTIVMFNEKPKNAVVINAKLLMISLKNKYKLSAG